MTGFNKEYFPIIIPPSILYSLFKWVEGEKSMSRQYFIN